MRAHDHETISTKTSARISPTRGDSTIAARVLPSPDQTMAPKPALAVPAPTMPPTSAWELDDGMPSAQVITFQAIAPLNAPKITVGSMMAVSTMPVPMVCATCNPKKAKAMKLKNAAQITANCGRSTLVDTMVAMELAASCNPFRKSNSSAIATSP